MMSKQETPSYSENRELQLSLELVENTDCHIFLTGKAGTGKTTFLKNLKKNSAKRKIVTAPTGVAAINAGGVTLHSFFQLPFGPFIPGSEAFVKNKERIFRFSKQKKQIIKSLDLLVIDEISMVRADVLDAVDKVLQYHRRSSKAFGGVQLLLIGDLHQLPPVAKPREWDLLRQYYASIYFFSSLALEDIELVTIELKKVYRQSDDQFLSLLNKVRENRLDESCIDELNQRYIENFIPEENQGYITLTTHNRNADTINQKKLQAINKTAYDLDAQISGDFPEHSYPTFAKLSLKVSAQVMFLRNDASADQRYYNGKIGKITSISDGQIRVICPDDSEEISVESVEWENIKYSVNEELQEIEEEVIGRFTQFPLKPAWAITIHKSQGLTFDKAVIDAQAAFAQGQVYVALSRCKTFEGIVLSSPIPMRGIDMDEAITRFISNTRQNFNLEDLLETAKIRYQQELVIRCFNFQTLNNRLNYFNRLLSGNTGLVQISGVPDIKLLEKSARDNIIMVSEKFKDQLQGHFQKNTLPASDEYIQERVKKASLWFQKKFALIFDDLLKNLNLETDNKALAKKIKNAFDNLKQEIAVKLAGVQSCEHKFSPSQYLRAVSKAEIQFTPGKTKKHKAQKSPSYKESDIEHPQLFLQLKDWRLRLAKEKDIPAFQILHQQVLVQIVVGLPDNTQDLEKINGIGPKTLSNYGDDILEMVCAYRKEHGIKTPELPEIKNEPKKKEKPKKQSPGIDTKQVSLDMFKQGLSITAIATQRELVKNTVQGHLSHFIATGDLDIKKLLSAKKQHQIEEKLSQQSYPSLKRVKTELGDDFSYEDIKLVLAHLQYVKTGKK
ncbi:MAG: AAA family ATPase [Desulfobacteraceae bacterium]|nr:AAA family ATPase [Desulfobacteraceae bacterium]